MANSVYPSDTVKTRDINWREFVKRHDGESFDYESLFPIVYEWSNGRTFRDSGPTGAFYV